MTSREVAASRHPLIAALFIACAIVLGGGGSPNPGTELVLQLIFVVAALAWLWVPVRGGSMPLPRSWTFWLICLLVLALPLIQLVPLPPSVWTSLSGHEDRTAALALVDAEQTWRPLSHFPARTLAALLAMIPALFAFFAAASLDARGRWWLAGAVAAMVVVAALFGALQFSLGPTSPHIYVDYHPMLTGFQANRNAAADVFMIGLAAAATFFAPFIAARGRRERDRRGSALLGNRRTTVILLCVVVTVLFFATLLTASRMGIVLLPLALAGVWVILLPSLADLGRRRFLPALAALAAIPIVGLAAWQSGNRALGNVVDRFMLVEGGREEVWRDGWFAMTQAWPLGVGMGGAQPSLIAAERLEVLDPYLPNRVHNDYLELALEGGLLALVLFVVIALLLLAAGWRTWRQRPDERHLTALGATMLLVVALHSFVDYPLRSMALACLIGTGAGLLLSTPRKLATDGPIA